MESIRNRYPCKIIGVANLNDFSKKTSITYQAATKINIRTSLTKDVLDDPLLVEKFHPTDCIRLSFLAFGELILSGELSIEEAKERYNKISQSMFEDITNN
jgi:hypothetical protein